MPGGAHENMRGWSPEEDEMLLQPIETSGKRWKLIAEALGTSNPRTPAMVRNRYLRIERGRWLTEQGMSKNRCGQCGQLKRGHVCQAPRAAVGIDVDGQAARHQVARAQGEPGSPYSADGVGKLALGAPPLTYLGAGSDDTQGPMSYGDSPELGMLPNGTPGRTPASLVGIMGTLGTHGAPPGLRPQSSFDMLLRASELRASSEQPPDQKLLADTPSVVPGQEMCPFRSGAREPTVPEMNEASTLTPADIAGGCGTPGTGLMSPRQPENLAPNANRRIEVES